MGIITPNLPSIPPLGDSSGDPGQQLLTNIQALAQSPYDTAQQALANAILQALGSPPSTDYATIIQTINNVINTPYGTDTNSIDAYMHFGLTKADMEGVTSELNGNITNPPTPPGPFSAPIQVTMTDDVYGGIMASFVSHGFTDPTLTALNNAYLAAFMQKFGSNPTLPYTGDQGSKLLDSIFTDPNFFTTYSGITYPNLQDYLGDVLSGYQIPDFLQNFISMGTSTWTANDAPLQQPILNQMRLDWNLPDPLASIQGWVLDSIIAPGFNGDYSTVDLAGATQMETALGMTPSMVPQLQTQYLETRTWLATLAAEVPPNPAAQALAQSLMTLITDDYPSGTPAIIALWYTNQYGPTATQDVFMKNATVDNADIQTFYQYANGTSATITPTPADNNYISVANYRATLDPSSDDYMLLNMLLLQWSGNGGSNPSTAQQQQNMTWMFNTRDDNTKPNFNGLYVGSTPATQAFFQTFMSDPEGTALYNAIQSMDLGLYVPLVTAILQGVQGPPYDSTQILNNINNVFNQTFTDPKTGVACDFYMEFGYTSDNINGFVSMLDVIMGSKVCPTPPAATANDQAYTALSNWISTSDPVPFPQDMASLANAYLASIKSNIGSNGAANLFPTELNNLFKDPNFFADYPTVTIANFPDLTTFISQVNSACTGIMNYTLPDYTQAFLQIGYWQNPNSNPEDASMQINLLKAMQSGWTSGAIALKNYQINAGLVVQTGFPQPLDTCDIYFAQNLENTFGIPVPPLQTQFFETRTMIHSTATGVSAMGKDLMSEIMLPSMWPTGGSAAALATWYTNTYASTGSVDPFMKYYKVDVGSTTYPDIIQFYQIATGSTGTITPTTTDTNVAAAANYRDQFANTAPEWQLMNQYVQYFSALTPAPFPPFPAPAPQGPYNVNGGSNPTAAQLYQASQVAITTVIPSTAFLNANTKAQQMYLSFFTNYGVAVAALKQNLTSWGGYTSPQYQQDFAASMESSITAFMKMHPNSTQQQFQAYLNEKFTETDYSFTCPGLAPTDITTFFSPYNITFTSTDPTNVTIFPPVDTVFANVYNGLQAATQPADQDFLTTLLTDVQNPAQQSLSSILYTLCVNANSMSQYQQSTQNAIDAIFQNDPVAKAYAQVYSMIQQEPADAAVFTSLLGTVGQSVDNPVQYPGVTNINTAIVALYNSPEWAELQPGSQTALILLFNLNPFINTG